jgi:DNA/RNA endonuclease G (NUC1)
MEARIVEKENVEATATKYPYLGEDDYGLVILFVAPEEGTVVIPSGVWSLGYHSKSWAENSFEPLPAGTTVVLNN